MQALIDDLLAFTQTTDEERKFESADIGAIVSEVLVEMKEIIDEKQAVIELTPHCQVRVIPLQFRQLMHNLINNALKFSIPGVAPYIRIDLQIEKGSVLNDSVAQRNASLLPHLEYCHITIEDNGVGFDQKYSEKIFEVFQRLHSREKYQGTGIGLAIVKKIVDNHKGIILATGTPNAGATFDIYIPTT